MKPTVWREQDGQLLQQLRQSAQIDHVVFARTNTISLAQLRELEGHGEGHFYNAQIKANTGHKLLKKLGHVPDEAAPAPAPEPSSGAVPVAPAPPLAPLQTTADGLAGLQASPSLPLEPRRSRMRPQWAAALLLLGGVAWAVWRTPWPAIPSPSVLTDTLTGTLTGAPTFAPASGHPLSVPADDTLTSARAAVTAPDTAASDATTHTPVSKSVATDDQPVTVCASRQQEPSAAYETTDPIKAGNYIHFVALQDVILCVKDRQNKLTDLRLKAGSAKSVYGAPPFWVHSPSWSSLQIFYQGRRVSGTPNGAAYWVFKNKDL